MTDAASRATSTDPDGPRPPLLTAAAILTGAVGVLDVVFYLLSFADRAATACQLRARDKSVDTKLTQQVYTSCIDNGRSGTAAAVKALSGAAVPTDSAVTKAILTGVILSAIIGGLFVVLAVITLRGRYFARWALLVLYVLSTVTQLVPFGALAIPSALASGSNDDIAARAVLLVGGLAFLAAVVLVNVKSVTRYLNAHRPVRTAASRPAAGQGGLFGGMFGAGGRAAPRGTGAPTSSSASRGATAASTRNRPKSAAGDNVSLSKGAGAATPNRPASSTPNRPAKAKARGKSRRG